MNVGDMIQRAAESGEVFRCLPFIKLRSSVLPAYRGSPGRVCERGRIILSKCMIDCWPLPSGVARQNVSRSMFPPRVGSSEAGRLRSETRAKMRVILQSINHDAEIVFANQGKAGKQLSGTESLLAAVVAGLFGGT